MSPTLTMARCSSPAASEIEVGAPEIEVTSEMVAAAVVVGTFDEVVAYGSETARLTAIEAYLAMCRARHTASEAREDVQPTSR